MNNHLERAKALQKYFGVFGYGNFDLTVEDIAELLRALESDNPDQSLEELYARLEATRMV